ncbi:MAG: ABC transporter permease [Bacteroidota bacterium]
MFKHLFKLIWNKKKQNALLITEMLVSFMVMFAVFSMAVNVYRNYKIPMGFEYENVWVINLANSPKFKTADSSVTYYRNVRNTLMSMPQVMEVSYSSSNTPFTGSFMSTGYKYKGKQFNNISYYQVDNYYKKAFNLQLLEGRWFNKEDDAAAYRPVVINQSFKQEIFGNDAAVGKNLDDYDGKTDQKRNKIVGVVADLKDHGDFKPTDRGIYSRADSGFYKWMSRIIVKVAPSADAAFEGRLYKTTAGMMKQAVIDIEHFTKKRDAMNKENLTPIIITTILAAFLIINVALGLFGVLWYNINKRRGEIGLRRAVGASGNSVSWQIVAESMVLATLSLILGVFFAVQFPLLNLFDLSTGVYVNAIVLSVIFIYLLVFICSLYPGKQAAAIYPAVALHEE